MSGRKRTKRRLNFGKWRAPVASLLLIVMAFTGGCFLDHEVEPYYGKANAPKAQEFRWSDGGLPQVFDPALAAVPPDTDAVRAMFEGLTEYDPKTLEPVPGVAVRWESSEDNRVWTFYLRHDARWSNNDPVTAQDFVRSWQRTLELGDRAPHAKLLRNIEGALPPTVLPQASPSPEAQAQAQHVQNGREEGKKETRAETPPPPPKFGAEAVDLYTLRVRLQQPDPNFPALVSHPVYRPVHDAGEAPTNTDGVAASSQHLVSNGAFQLSKAGGDGVVLERAKNYWDAQSVSLQRVQFMPTKDAESALAAYHAGDVDAVTNAGFEPLALKLLAPYKDFRRATFGALNYYSFNTSKTPFNDVRVREALSIAIDRDRLSEDELGGATEPAKKFLPAQMTDVVDADHAQTPLIERDVERAKKLLADAGFPNGLNFPKIRLLINRNAQQRDVAEAVAAMWKSALNIDTEIILKNWDEYEASFRAGDYDVARRSYVMQTADEESSLREMLEPETLASSVPAQTDEQAPTAQAPEKNGKAGTAEVKQEGIAQASATPQLPLPAFTEARAMKELPAMPIYFASSYALVKPYVVGFDANLLDAPSLKRVRIDTSWQPPKQSAVLWLKSGE
jgi:ABC-type oligopeptide transport system substrate-binding subunit